MVEAKLLCFRNPQCVGIESPPLNIYRHRLVCMQSSYCSPKYGLIVFVFVIAVDYLWSAHRLRIQNFICEAANSIFHSPSVHLRAECADVNGLGGVFSCQSAHEIRRIFLSHFKICSFQTATNQWVFSSIAKALYDRTFARLFAPRLRICISPT